MIDVLTQLFCCEFLAQAGDLGLRADPRTFAEVASA